MKNKVDTKKWKYFLYKDFFELISDGKKLSNKDLSDIGKIPVYSSSTTNNGCFGYTEKAADYIIDEKRPMYLIFGDHTKSMFIIKESFSIMDNVKVFIPKIFNEYCIRYITTVWQKSIPDLGYARHWTIAKNIPILLPIDLKGKPDWDYMEQYMKDIEKHVIKSLKGLNKYNDKINKIDISKWKKYKIGKLFDANNTGNILARDVVDGSGHTPYVTASGVNNGVMAYIDASKYQIIKGNCILVGGKTFTLTYQKEDFVSNDSHNFEMHLKKNTIGMYEYLFIISVLRKTFSNKYYWGDAVTKGKFLEEEIILPSTRKNEPDWEFMKEYIINNINNSKDKLKCLNNI